MKLENSVKYECMIRTAQYIFSELKGAGDDQNPELHVLCRSPHVYCRR